MISLIFRKVLSTISIRNIAALFVLTLMIAFFNYLNADLLTYAEESLSLQECIKIALSENPEFKNAERRTTLAKTQKSDAIAAYLPNINAVLSSSQTRVGPTINNRVVYQGIELSEGANYESPGFVTNSHYIGTTISQLLFDGGASISRIKQENARVSAAHASQQSIRSQVILECKRRFYALIKAEEYKRVAEKSLEVAEQQSIHTQLLLDGGVVPRLDVYQARVAYNNVKMLLLQSLSRVEDARTALNNYLGRKPETQILLIHNEEIVRPLQYTPVQTVEIAMKNNFYIHSLELEVKSNQYNAGVNRSGFLPTISFTGSYYRYNSTFSKVYGQFDKNYSLYYGLVVNYNLINGFRHKNDLQKGQIRLSIAEENLEAARREISASVSSAVRKHSMLVEMLTLQKESILESSEAVRVTKEQYANGQGTLLDVLSAESNLVSTEFQSIETQFEAIIAEAELEDLLGIE